MTPEEPVETVVFPQLSGLNWPSYLLQAWRTLYALGVPEENIRFLPEIGHFAVPEIFAQELPGPAYDPLSERLIVYRVDPQEVRPRLMVSVRADIIEHFLLEGEGNPERRESHLVGRLAHFVPPLLAGLPGAPPPARPHSPLEDSTQQVCAMYPEMMQTLMPEVRSQLETGADDILAVLAETSPERQAMLIQQAARRVSEPEQRLACREAWQRMADKLPLDGLESQVSMMAFRRWALLLYGANLEAAADDSMWTEFSPQEAEWQRGLLRAQLTALSYETTWERKRIVREMMEIVSSEALLATTVIDSLCGIGWIHGRISDQRVNSAGAGRLDGWFLSVTGGQNSRTAIQSRLEEWAAMGGFLGVGRAGDQVDLDVLETDALTETERMQLWSLVVWRREAADPFVLLETAARRLIHPDVVVRLTHFAPVQSRPGTLLAQPGSTAVLGGAAQILYPGVTVEVPLGDQDKDAPKARTTLTLLVRLFLPVCCRIEVLWRESAARLDRPSYLRHDFQTGARLSGTGEDLAESEPAGGATAF